MAPKKSKEERQADLRKDVDFDEHRMAVEDICTKYGCTLEGGLPGPKVKENAELYGENRLTPPPTKPEWLKFVEQFTNFFAILLIGGAILCFVGYAIDPDKDQTNLGLGIVLAVVVLITGLFSYFQESKSEKIMEGFKSMIPRKCKCIRDGNIQVLEATDLVKGDVVLLNEGDQIPADIRIVESTELKVDNSSLTGEAEPQERGPNLLKDADGKDIDQALEANNLVFYTTLVNSGAGKGIVCGVGDGTAMGQIAGLATETSMDDTPIAKEIKAFIKIISAIAIFLGVTFFFIGLGLGTEHIKNVVFMIGIIVANVPEGLLATVTVSLALTAQRMYKKNVLVKNLEAVETLGSTTVIASDKTGTLTQNRMTVSHCWYDDAVCKTPSGKNTAHFAKVMKDDYGEPVCDLDAATFKRLNMIAAVSNNAKFITKTDDDAPAINVKESMAKDDFNLLGMGCTSDASEAGLVKFSQCVRDIGEYRAAMPKLFEIKFNSTNKWACSIHKQENEADPDILLLKGAPERVIKMCKYIMIKGEILPFNDEWMKKYDFAYESIGGLGERCLGFAFREMKDFKKGFAYTNKPEPNFPLDDLVFCGLFSLIDSPREGVPEAVAKCKRASIKVFMVTGDHPITAQAIAEQIGIIDKGNLEAGKATVVKGDDIRDIMALEPAEQEKKWDHILSFQQIVFARVSPAHKLIICENAQQRGEIVAVTGDGVNDAPALKKGDIGVAMGIMGKDVSKEAADMILMDDNFASIVNGVEEGRLIFDNLKKSISYTLTSNIPEIGPFLCYITINIPPPLSTVLILFVDLGTDMVPAISLAYETKESDIMDRPPRNAATDRLVNRRLIFFAYFQIGMMQVLAGFFTYCTVMNDYGYAPRILMGTGLMWEDYPLMCDMRPDGQPGKCGYGCADPVFPDGLPKEERYCVQGCNIPVVGTVDAFSEFTPAGFRGFDGGIEKVCGRSCEWFAKNGSTGNAIEDQMFTEVCAAASDAGFKGRVASFSGEKRSASEAPEGAFYWWGGGPQVYPNKGYQSDALKYAQTAYFISIIVVQWADLLISKTRKLSLFEQGMRNQFMNFGLCFETLLGIFFIYTPPLNDAFFTRPIHGLHWFTGVPWSLMIFIYDEVRKYIIRKNPGGWIERFTYW